MRVAVTHDEIPNENIDDECIVRNLPVVSYGAKRIKVFDAEGNRSSNSLVVFNAAQMQYCIRSMHRFVAVNTGCHSFADQTTQRGVFTIADLINAGMQRGRKAYQRALSTAVPLLKRIFVDQGVATFL